MKSHTKIIVIAVLGGIIALSVAFIVLNRPEKGTLAATIPLLASRTPSGEFDVLTNFSRTGTASLASKNHTTTYEIDQEFAKVHEALKKDLKSRYVSASSYPAKKPTFSMYSIGATGKPGSAIISVRGQPNGKTTVAVVEARSVNVLDRMKIWFGTLRSSRKGGIAVYTDARTIR